MISAECDEIGHTEPCSTKRSKECPGKAIISHPLYHNSEINTLKTGQE